MALAPALALLSCTGATPADQPTYLGAEATLLDEGLVNLVVHLRGGDESALVDYSRCAVAGYALDRGFGFARQVRTSLGQEAGIRRADAVYTLSSSLPRGVRTLDAEVIVADCRARGIPTV